MAHKKGLGSSRNGRDSNAQRLGVKTFAGQQVTGGEIIVRQRGSRFKAGEGVGMGKDDTLYARAAGTVRFSVGRRGRVVSIDPARVSARAAASRGAPARPMLYDKARIHVVGRRRRRRLGELPPRGARAARRPGRRRRRPWRRRRDRVRRVAARPAVVSAPHALPRGRAAASGGGSLRHGATGAPLVAARCRRARRCATDGGDVHDLLRARPARGRRPRRLGRARQQALRDARRARRRASPSAACRARRRSLELALKLLADVGLVGLPNAGKSSLLARLTRAAPKIADYPFTTLEPVLGTLEGDDRQLIVADIPGLIEGASEGAGLGHDFLAHIERTRLLVHVLDLAPLDGSDPLVNHATVERELERHDPRLAALPRVLALSKADLVDAAARGRPPPRPGASGSASDPRARHLERDARRARGARARAARSACPLEAPPAARRRAGRARRARHLPPGRRARLSRRAHRATASTASSARASTCCSRATTSTTTRRSPTSSRGCARSA